VARADREEDVRMTIQTRVKENSQKKENKTGKSSAKKQTEKVETERADPQYDEDIRR
jgi:hypothetical protein